MSSQDKPSLAIWDMTTDRERECFRAGSQSAREVMNEELLEWTNSPRVRYGHTEYVVSSVRLIPTTGGEAIEADFRQFAKSFRRIL